jgi:iron complex outermembrane receptor protein
MLQIGNDGITHTIDDLYKWKGGFDINADLNTTFTVAYENFEVSKVGQSFLKNTGGQTVWGSQLAGNSADGYKLSNSSAFGKSNQTRETLTLGWGLNGRVTGNWYTNTNISFFDILSDTTIASSYNPSDSAFRTNNSGTLTSWADSGWINISSKFNNEEFLGRKDLSFATGYEYQHAEMMQTVNNLSNYSSKTFGATQPLSTKSGGQLDTHGLFGQLSWRFEKDWDATVGTRLRAMEFIGWNIFECD